MEIRLRTVRNSIAELIIESQSAKITEDVTLLGGEVDGDLIEDLFTTAFDMARFNGRSDVDTIKDLFDLFLNDTEKTEFLDLIGASK